uniref:Zinc finger MYM-type protein 1-like n=1 Tax=Oryzias sinensis TaxID=183150 RepID=A0A8C8DNF5_9TELE
MVVVLRRNNRLFCFCCKLFSKKNINLTNPGFNNWKHAGYLINLHDNSPDHIYCMKIWKELAVIIKRGESIDKQEMALFEAETKRWREVLKRFIAIIKSLAVRNLALRGHTETLYSSSNGNFLKVVELMAEFDPVMKEHVIRVQKATSSHPSYLGKVAQNEIIQLMSSHTISVMVNDIKRSRFFSIILDCTPDISHIEQPSVVLRVVSLEEKPCIKEYFMGFLEAEESTGEHLTTAILKNLEELSISFEDCRCQAYDNGANMRGKNKGVQARLLQLNPRALFVPCGAHTLNPVVADAAKTSRDATNYFGILQKLYSLFSASTQRWAILKKHVKVTLKMWTDTRWESKVKSVEPMRYQSAAVREALLEVRDNTKDPVIKTEAQSLSEEVGSYRFSICTVVWYDILSHIQYVSKMMQSATMQVDIAVNLLHKTETALRTYRATGFVAAETSAKVMCEEMNVKAALQKKRLRSTKHHFTYESSDKRLRDALKKLEVEFFNAVVDCTVSAIQERFKTLQSVGDTFCVLSNFQTLSDEVLKSQCQALGATLQYNGQSDLDGDELIKELKHLPNLPKQTMTQHDLLSFLHDSELTELYPNLWTALRISLTLPVTVAEAERSFSKLKLIKTFLRSSMAQDRLSGLAVISINHTIAEKLNYDVLIDDFARIKARRAHF